MPQFQRQFGNEQPDGSYELTAAWQTGLNNATQCGQILGLIINGWVSERFGYRKTVIVCLALIAAWVGILFTATTPQTLLAAYLLCGIVRLLTSFCNVYADNYSLGVFSRHFASHTLPRSVRSHSVAISRHGLMPAGVSARLSVLGRSKHASTSKDPEPSAFHTLFNGCGHYL